MFNGTIRRGLTGFLFAALAWGQTPVVNSVLNAGDFSTRLCPGCDVAIFGSGFAANATVTVGGQTAYVNLKSPSQMNVQFPYTAPTGTAAVVVTQSSASSTPVNVTLLATAPAFLGNQAVYDAATFHLIGSSNPAVPGQLLSAFLNGLGLTSPPVNAGPPPTGTYLTATTPTVALGGTALQPSQIRFSGLQGQTPGVYQINFTVPANVSAGTYNLAVSIGGQTSNTYTLPVTTDQYRIDTVAGAPPPSSVPATSGVLGAPTYMLNDGAGNLYVANATGNNIAKIALSGPTLTIYAGNGFAGYAGDGGPAQAASLNGGAGMAVNSGGNLYIADSGNCLIRKITAGTGVITTFAGVNGQCTYNGENVQALSAQISPTSLAFNAAGDLYFADPGNQRVRRIDHVTNAVTTVAGTGTGGFNGDNMAASTAQLKNPMGVVFDSTGNLYINDKGNNRIRRISGATITTYAGTGGSGYNGEGLAATSATINGVAQIAIDASNNLYLTLAAQNRLRTVDAATQHMNTIAGTGAVGNSGNGGSATSATFSSLFGVSVDSSGNIYVADSGANVIRKIVPGSPATISAFAGFLGGNGIAPTSAPIGGPSAVTLDSLGNLFIATQVESRVLEVNSGLTSINTVAGVGFEGPASGNGGTATSVAMNSPFSTAVDSSGNLFIADTGNNEIRRVDASTHTITNFAGSPTGAGGFSGNGVAATSALLNNPRGVAVDALGNVYIAEAGNNTIRVVSGGIISTIAGNGTAGYNGEGILAANALLNGPRGIAVDSTGNIYFAEAGNNRVRKILASDLTIHTIAGTGVAGYSGDGGPATAAQLSFPFGVAVDSAGNVYIGEINNSAVRKISAATGNISTIAGTGSCGFNGPGQIATNQMLCEAAQLVAAADGRIYLTDTGNDSIRRLTPQYYLLTGVSPSGAGSISPASGSVDANTVVNISASANPGFQFTGFTGSLSGTSSPASLTMNSGKNVVANFIPLNPSILASVTSRVSGAGANERDYTLSLTNVGTGPGSACQITSATTQVLAGTGAPPAIVTSLPFAYGNIATGASAVQTIALTVAPTVSRFLLTIGGSCNNAASAAISLTTTLAVFR